MNDVSALKKKILCLAPLKTGVCLLFFLIPFTYNYIFAQNEDLKFDHIGAEQGLPQGTIHGIVKDKYGFMWFGTWGGLCRYDGYTFKTYKHDANDHKSINSNRIHHVVKDKDENIWISTFLKDTLCRYNYEKDNFDRVSTVEVSAAFLSLLDRGDHIRTVNFSNKQYNWNMDDGKSTLLRTDIRTGQKKYYTSNPSNHWSLNTSNISDIYLDNQGIFWVGTYSYGINKANLNAKPFNYYYHDPFTAQSLIYGNVSAVCQDNQGNLWVGTRDNGITIITKSGYKHITKGPNSILDNQIRAIFCDSKGVLWIGSKEGLNSYDPQTQRFRNFSDLGFANTSVYSITEDMQHNIWIGSWNGVCKYDPNSNTLKQWDYSSYTNSRWVYVLLGRSEATNLGGYRGRRNQCAEARYQSRFVCYRKPNHASRDKEFPK